MGSEAKKSRERRRGLRPLQMASTSTSITTAAPCRMSVYPARDPSLRPFIPSRASSDSTLSSLSSSSSTLSSTSASSASTTLTVMWPPSEDDLLAKLARLEKSMAGQIHPEVILVFEKRSMTCVEKIKQLDESCVGEA
ncbi:hypothetical protein JCM11641_005139 [Rhodosporidiobolus odoratus]